jgi:hypothetical protein
MSKHIIAAVLVATGVGVGLAWSQTAAPRMQNHRYFTMALEKDPTRAVGLQEGEVSFRIKGQPPKVMKAGDWNYVPRVTIHRQ